MFAEPIQAVSAAPAIAMIPLNSWIARYVDAGSGHLLALLMGARSATTVLVPSMSAPHADASIMPKLSRQPGRCASAATLHRLVPAVSVAKPAQLPRE